MGRAVEVVTGFVTAPGAAFGVPATFWTMAAGNSLVVRNGKDEAGIYLLQMWADNQVAGALRIRSPKLHDNVQGIRATVLLSEVQPLLPIGTKQKLYSQDQLIAEQVGSAVAGDIESGAFLVYYEDLPGVEGRFLTEAQLWPRVRHIFPVENTIALGITGGYTGEEAINAEFDLFKANTDYALLGYLVSAECAVVRWRGADTGNLGIGGPGTETERHLTAQWFLEHARLTGLPLIPVFNSANKQGILLDGAQDENGVDVTVTSIFAELAPAA
jgi:hypothetical protein